MKFQGQKYRKMMSGFTLNETLITLGILVAGLVITLISVLFIRKNIEMTATQNFNNSCKEVRTRIQYRLEEHAQLLRSGEALFAVSDTVTREMWKEFYLRTKSSEYLPGIEGFGYSRIVPREKLIQHIRHIRQNGFPKYDIYPAGEREIYTSIIYLEPFAGRNLNAFGYDMYSEPVRRKAMEIARDSLTAMLSGKVELVQEANETNKQPGVLMYIPVFHAGMTIETVEQRRAAIKGWVYSPYRMKDLMIGIRSSVDLSLDNPLRLQIYDDNIISEETELYDSEVVDSVHVTNPNMHLELPVAFRNKKWSLVFTGRKEELSVFNAQQLWVWLTGFFITLLLFILSTLQIRTNIRNRQIEHLNKQLESLNADKDRFIAILSHDLKSPFTSILGFLELLSTGIRKYSLDQIESHVHVINDAARSTYNLLEDLLMWTRAHSGKIPFKPQMIPFREIYDNAFEILFPLAESKNITVGYSAPDDLQIIADMDMIKAIMRNLISNAVKFTDMGGSIKITASKDDEGVTVSVADTGVGINPGYQETIFDISKIFSTAGTKGEQGSGLGLVLCREFVETHGGRIWFTSEPFRGSDFRFFLPGK